MLLVSPFDVLERAEKIRREIHSLAFRISVHLITKNPFFLDFFFGFLFFWYSSVFTVLEFFQCFSAVIIFTLFTY